VWLTLFPVVAGGGLWAGYCGLRNFTSHNDVMCVPHSQQIPPCVFVAGLTFPRHSVRSKGAEPYLANESPKLLSRSTGVRVHKKWRDEMGGEPVGKN
jgi:hypothetical protein